MMPFWYEEAKTCLLVKLNLVMVKGDLICMSLNIFTAVCSDVLGFGLRAFTMSSPSELADASRVS